MQSCEDVFFDILWHIDWRCNLNIQKCEKYIFAMGAFAVSLGAGVWGYENAKEARGFKQEVKTKVTPERYIEMLENEPGTAFQNGYWKSHLDAANDSLKKDSLARRAYFEGGQLVKDSIK